MVDYISTVVRICKKKNPHDEDKKGHGIGSNSIRNWAGWEFGCKCAAEYPSESWCWFRRSMLKTQSSKEKSLLVFLAGYFICNWEKIRLTPLEEWECFAILPWIWLSLAVQWELKLGFVARVSLKSHFFFSLYTKWTFLGVMYGHWVARPNLGRLFPTAEIFPCVVCLF